jgi:hypothetical protein
LTHRAVAIDDERIDSADICGGPIREHGSVSNITERNEIARDALERFAGSTVMALAFEVGQSEAALTIPENTQ